MTLIVLKENTTFPICHGNNKLWPQLILTVSQQASLIFFTAIIYWIWSYLAIKTGLSFNYFAGKVFTLSKKQFQTADVYLSLSLKPLKT